MKESKEELKVNINSKEVTIQNKSSFAKVDENYYPLEEKEINGYKVPIDTKLIYENKELYVSPEFLKSANLLNFDIEDGKLIINNKVEKEISSTVKEEPKKEVPQSSSEVKKEEPKKKLKKSLKLQQSLVSQISQINQAIITTMVIIIQIITLLVNRTTAIIQTITQITITVTVVTIITQIIIIILVQIMDLLKITIVALKVITEAIQMEEILVLIIHKIMILKLVQENKN
ncbi:hypothetical protein LEQ08_00265 [Paraclostridium sp. AKS81]|nr:hypothetical protein [Paraclostridium sp. AKS81]